VNLPLDVIREVGKQPQTGGAAKFWGAPDKNGFSHVAESFQYLLVGGVWCGVWCGAPKLARCRRSP
jgi:hypothetical protein